MTFIPYVSSWRKLDFYLSDPYQQSHCPYQRRASKLSKPLESFLKLSEAAWRAITLFYLKFFLLGGNNIDLCCRLLVGGLQFCICSSKTLLQLIDSSVFHRELLKKKSKINVSTQNYQGELCSTCCAWHSDPWFWLYMLGRWKTGLFVFDEELTVLFELGFILIQGDLGIM